MGSVRKVQPTALKIEELRSYYHSVNDAERADVISLLGSMEDPDAVRELISLYEKRQWRSTRLPKPRFGRWVKPTMF
jgi:hypothetical protein